MRGVRAGQGSVAGSGAGRRPVGRASRSTASGRVVTVGLLLAALLSSAAPAVAGPDDAVDPADGDAREGDAQAETDAAGAAAEAEAAAEEAAAVARQEAAARAVRDAGRELTRARAVLREARAGHRAAKAGGSAADGRVRVAEEALPPLVLARRELELELASVDAELRRLRVTERRARAELVTARDALTHQAIATFKTGRSAELIGPVAVLREARDPGELARGLADLRAATRDGARSVRSLQRELREVAEAARQLEGRRASLTAELDAATGAVEVGEDGAAEARAAAAAVERRLVAAMEAELTAERALERAEERHAERVAAADEVAADIDAAPDGAGGDAPDGRGPAVLPGAGGPEVAATGEAAPTDDAGAGPDAEQVAGRRRALERAERLTPQQRRTAEAWHCPVDDARFVNDWAFPRSGLRRHEGTDVFGDRGTPILAVTGGTVTVLDATDGRGDLGGITVTVADGEARQYYAHLERLDPDLDRGDVVRPGDRLGWVGTSGNARGTPPHLHLGWYVDDVAVNPYASLAVACDGRSQPARPDDTVPADTADEGEAGGEVAGDARAADDGEPTRRGPRPIAGAAAGQGWRIPSPARTAR